MHESFDEFEFRTDHITDYGVSCLWGSEKSMYNAVNTLAPSFIAHLSRRLKGGLIVYQTSRRLCVCVSVCVSVNIFKLEYLRNQWANRNEILSEPSLGWGKGCIRFWSRSDRTQVSMATDSSHRVIRGKML